jgi:hypothetical protein
LIRALAELSRMADGHGGTAAELALLKNLYETLGQRLAGLTPVDPNAAEVDFRESTVEAELMSNDTPAPAAAPAAAPAPATIPAGQTIDFQPLFRALYWQRPDDRQILMAGVQEMLEGAPWEPVMERLWVHFSIEQCQKRWKGMNKDLPALIEASLLRMGQPDSAKRRAFTEWFAHRLAYRSG